MIKKLTLTVICLLAGIMCLAQGKIQTKKFRFSDFREKTTKVVLTGSVMTDAMFKDGVKQSWIISPFEFCEPDDFERYMSDSENYFLLLSDSRFCGEDEAGIMTISVCKGNAKATSGLDGLDKVMSIPFCASEDSDGSEIIFLPLLLRCLQNNVEATLENNINLGSMVKVRHGKKNWSVPVFIDSSDLAVAPDSLRAAACEAAGIYFRSSDEIADIVKECRPDCLVEYTVAPQKTAGHKFFKMLLNPCTAELYMMEKGIASEKKPAAFSSADLDFILSKKK